MAPPKRRPVRGRAAGCARASRRTRGTRRGAYQGPSPMRPWTAAAQALLGLGPHGQVVVDHRHLPVEQEVGVGRVGLERGSRSSSRSTSRSRNVWNGEYHSRSQWVWPAERLDLAVGRQAPREAGVEPNEVAVGPARPRTGGRGRCGSLGGPRPRTAPASRRRRGAAPTGHGRPAGGSCGWRRAGGGSRRRSCAPSGPGTCAGPGGGGGRSRRSRRRRPPPAAAPTAVAWLTTSSAAPARSGTGPGWPTRPSGRGERLAEGRAVQDAAPPVERLDGPGRWPSKARSP